MPALFRTAPNQKQNRDQIYIENFRAVLRNLHVLRVPAEAVAAQILAECQQTKPAPQPSNCTRHELSYYSKNLQGGSEGMLPSFKTYQASI